MGVRLLGPMRAIIEHNGQYYAVRAHSFHVDCNADGRATVHLAGHVDFTVAIPVDEIMVARGEVVVDMVPALPEPPKQLEGPRD